MWSKMNMAFYYYFFNHTSSQTWCSVMVCFDASGPGWLVVTDRTMISALDQKILECQAIILCPRLLGCSRRTMIWDTPTSPPFIGSKIKKNVLQWPGQSPDINLIEMFWQDHKQAVHSCTLQCGNNKIAPISSTAMWKTHCELSQTLRFSSCCWWWHNQSLGLGANTFHWLLLSIGLNTLFLHFISCM